MLSHFAFRNASPQSLSGSVPSIPFSGTIEADNQIVYANGNNTLHRRITKVARDTKGRSRIDVDLNPIGTSTDPKLVTVHIYDAVTKTDITLFPWRQFAMRYEDKPLPQPMPGRRPAPIAGEPDHLGLGKQPQPRIDIQREELAAEVIEGMQLRHGRETSRILLDLGLIKRPTPSSRTTGIRKNCNPSFS